jgi:hypothetical protein
VSIPFGYVLLLHPGAIHGDSTLTGLYLMGMTGNHTAMNTADSVFLKSPVGTVKIQNTRINDNTSDQSICLKNAKITSSTNVCTQSGYVTMTHSKCDKNTVKHQINYNTIPQLLLNVYKDHFIKYFLWRPILFGCGFSNVFSYL